MNAPQVEIYTLQTCPYCARAKALLDSKGVVYQEHSIDDNEDMRQAMIERAGRTSVPQIFIGAHHVGGCDDLHDLEAAGKLDALLKT